MKCSFTLKAPGMTRARRKLCLQGGDEARVLDLHAGDTTVRHGELEVIHALGHRADGSAPGVALRPSGVQAEVEGAPPPAAEEVEEGVGRVGAYHQPLLRLPAALAPSRRLHLLPKVP